MIYIAVNTRIQKENFYAEERFSGCNNLMRDSLFQRSLREKKKAMSAFLIVLDLMLS